MLALEKVKVSRFSCAFSWQVQSNEPLRKCWLLHSAADELRWEILAIRNNSTVGRNPAVLKVDLLDKHAVIKSAICYERIESFKSSA